jgi:predicted transcriptional regulator
MKQLVKTGKFRISDLPFTKSQRHTVRRTLRVMEEQEWLSRENDRAATWRMGELAELHLNVSADKIEAAKS